MSRIPNSLINIVYDIYRSTTDYEERRKYYMEKYPEFVNTYSKLFEMLCKPRFNFDKFIEITYNLSVSNKKRKICSKESYESYEVHAICGKRKRNNEDTDVVDVVDVVETNIMKFDNTHSANILLPKLEKLFIEQTNAIEYLV